MIKDLTEAIIKQVYDSADYKTMDGDITFYGKCIIKLCNLISDIDARNLTSKNENNA